jgi:hypothetical protein
MGILVHRLASAAATDNSTLIRVGANRLVGWHARASGTGVKFIKFYDKATAPLVGDTPILTIGISAGDMSEIILPYGGIIVHAGLGYRITNGAGDADATAVAAGDMTMNIFVDGFPI